MGKVNPWFEEKLRKLNSPRWVSCIVKFPEDVPYTHITSQLRKIKGLTLGGRSFNMVRVSVSPEMISRIAEIPGVTVSYDQPMTVGTAPAILDPLIGKFSISSIEIPLSPGELGIRFGPRFLRKMLTGPPIISGLMPGPFKAYMANLLPTNPDFIFVPTSETRTLLNPPEDNIITQTKIAVLDTGIGFPDKNVLKPHKGLMWMRSTIEQPNPLDGLGHGHWCITAACGDLYKARLGWVQGIVDPRNGTLGSVKCLSTFGFGTSWSVIQAMEKAVKWGAKVISMSLGGELQGSVQDDPQCQIIEGLKDQVIFVVAAGNDGPSSWTIGSPGASPFAVTVGSWSPYYDGVSIFSSRGPNAPWYKEHPEDWERDVEKYGQKMIKPDLVAPGGGPVEGGQIPDLIYSAVRGWTDGMNDLLPGDGFDGMRGTSMSTPQAFGIIGLAVDRGLVSTEEDVKSKLRNGNGTKSSDFGYGSITWNKLGG